MVPRLLSGYAIPFRDMQAFGGDGRCKHKHSTAAAHRRPLGRTDRVQEIEVNMRRSASEAFLMANVIALFSCSDRGVDLLSSIENSSWSLQRFEISGSPTVWIPPGQSYTLEFRTSTEIGGVSHCNVYRASYTLISHDTISFHDIISTEMACPLPSYDGEFQGMLGQVRIVKLVRDQLQLSNSDHTQILYFDQEK